MILIGLMLSLGFSSAFGASRTTTEPLDYVEADSLVIWGCEESDFRVIAMQADPHVRVRPLHAKTADAASLPAWLQQWQQLLPSMDALGRVVEADQATSVVPTCNGVKLAGKLFLHTRDVQYMDAIERAAYHTFMPLARQDGPLHFEKRMAAQSLMDIMGMMYATDSLGVYVNFYRNSSAHIRTSAFDVIIDQLTEMPHGKRVKLRMGGRIKGQQPLVVRLRMPYWCYGNLPAGQPYTLTGVPDKLPVVYVNGREAFYKMENGYLVINRKWNRGDEVFFDFPFEPQRLQLRQAPAAETIFAVQYGPLLYGAATGGFVGELLPGKPVTQLDDTNRYGHSLLGATVQQPDGQTKNLRLEPVAVGAACCWFHDAAAKAQ